MDARRDGGDFDGAAAMVVTGDGARTVRRSLIQNRGVGTGEDEERGGREIGKRRFGADVDETGNLSVARGAERDAEGEGGDGRSVEVVAGDARFASAGVAGKRVFARGRAGTVVVGRPAPNLRSGEGQRGRGPEGVAFLRRELLDFDFVGKEVEVGVGDAEFEDRRRQAVEPARCVGVEGFGETAGVERIGGEDLSLAAHGEGVASVVAFPVEVRAEDEENGRSGDDGRRTERGRAEGGRHDGGGGGKFVNVGRKVRNDESVFVDCHRGARRQGDGEGRRRGRIENERAGTVAGGEVERDAHGVALDEDGKVGTGCGRGLRQSVKHRNRRPAQEVQRAGRDGGAGGDCRGAEAKREGGRGIGGKREPERGGKGGRRAGSAFVVFPFENEVFERPGERGGFVGSGVGAGGEVELLPSGVALDREGPLPENLPEGRRVDAEGGCGKGRLERRGGRRGFGRAAEGIEAGSEGRVGREAGCREAGRGMQGVRGAETEELPCVGQGVAVEVGKRAGRGIEVRGEGGRVGAVHEAVAVGVAKGGGRAEDKRFEGVGKAVHVRVAERSGAEEGCRRLGERRVRRGETDDVRVEETEGGEDDVRLRRGGDGRAVGEVRWKGKVFARKEDRMDAGGGTGDGGAQEPAPCGRFQAVFVEKVEGRMFVQREGAVPGGEGFDGPGKVHGKPVGSEGERRKRERRRWE